MNTIIFRTVAPFLACVMVLFSLFVLLRGHNEPGGGFIGGLIAVSAFAIYGMACGPKAVRSSFYFRPISIAGFGMALAALCGFPSFFTGNGYLTGLWVFPEIAGIKMTLSTPLFFDIGVYLVVVGAISSIILWLEEGEEF